MNMHWATGKKSIAWMTASVMAITMLAGCGSSDQSASGSPSASAGGTSAPASGKPAEGPTTITFMTTLFGAQPPQIEGSEYIKKAEAYTNTKLSYTFVPGDNMAYENKLNVSLASGDLAMVTVVTNYKGGAIVNGIRNGQFWEVGPYIKNYPNLSKIFEPSTLANVAIDGKNYSLPRPRPTARNGLVYRKDWLDAVGLPEPKTLDDVYAMAKAFTEKDPDKNGKNDTFGLTSNEVFNAGFDIVTAALGNRVGWYSVGSDNKLHNNFDTKEYVDALQFFRKLYAEKLMNQDFATQKSPIDAFVQGKAGIVFEALDGMVNFGKVQEMLKNNPNAKLGLASTINGKTSATPGYNGVVVFPKSAIKTEDQLKKVLSFLDKMNDESMLLLNLWGVEGKNYSLKDGSPEPLDRADFASNVAPFALPLTLAPIVQWPKDSADAKKYKQLQLDNVKNAVSDPTWPFSSQTYTEKGSDLTKKLNDARVKFVFGEMDAAGWAAFVSDWKKQGGDKVMEEFNVEYQKNKDTLK